MARGGPAWAQIISKPPIMPCNARCKYIDTDAVHGILLAEGSSPWLASLLVRCSLRSQDETILHDPSKSASYFGAVAITKSHVL